MELYIIPLMTGILAWFIAWLFVKLIFGSNDAGIQSLIHQIDISKWIQKENADASFEAILPFIDEQLTHFFTHKLGVKMPMVSLFIGEKTIGELKVVFVEELRIIFPSLMEQLAVKTKQDFSKNLTEKWKPLLTPLLMKATRSFRILAFCIGLIWGILILILTHHAL